MPEAIAGLRMEGGAVLRLNDQTQDWESAPTSMVPQIEELLRRLEASEYPETTVRENAILKRERDIGIGSVESFKDEDGDLTVTYLSVPKPDAEINEDAAFGLEPVDESPSFGGDAGGGHSHENVSNAPDASAKKAARKSVPRPSAEVAVSYLRKRAPSSTSSPLGALAGRMRRVFLGGEYVRSRRVPADPERKSGGISFISRKCRGRNRGGDSGLLIGVLRSNRRDGVKNTPEEKFYLVRRCPQTE